MQDKKEKAWWGREVVQLDGQEKTVRWHLSKDMKEVMEQAIQFMYGAK